MARMFKYIFVLLLTVIATYGMSYSSDFSYGEGVKFEEKYMMDDVIKVFQEKNIPYLIDNEGFITYPSKHKDKVDEIIISLKARPVMYFKNKKYADKFLGFLEEEKIYYEVRNSIDGEIHIFWKKDDDKKVQKIITNSLK